jgi:hypothetical protein
VWSIEHQNIREVCAGVFPVVGQSAAVGERQVGEMRLWPLND